MVDCNGCIEHKDNQLQKWLPLHPFQRSVRKNSWLIFSRNFPAKLGFLRAQDRVCEVFSQSSASSRVKQKPHTTFSWEHLAVRTDEDKQIPSKQLSTKKPHDIVSPAEWQFCNTTKVFCNYSHWSLCTKSLADSDAWASFINFSWKYRRIPSAV